ncbi:hypothetical protein ACSSV6_003476 [Roseovarius sp. MBR-38]|uniref:COG3904 family protein n=1 Tax=Roseovarius sp. MBR-78 TaxID=3156460 RepID=UPI003396F4E5
MLDRTAPSGDLSIKWQATWGMSASMGAMMIKYKMITTFLALTLAASPVSAVDLRIFRSNASSTVVMSGTIETGDAEVFEDFWKEKAYDAFSFVIAMDSPGGSLRDAIKIGRFIRETGAKTEIRRFAPSTEDEIVIDWPQELPGAVCYSACALAFMGGYNREIQETAEIGFHQFSGGQYSDSEDALIAGQGGSAILANYLREMGAKPELFEMMALTEPNEMYVPTPFELVSLGVIPSTTFHDFELQPRGGLIVATATNPRNIRSLQRVYEIETMCWKGTPIINFYAQSKDDGLSSGYANPATTHMKSFQIVTDFGSVKYGNDRLRLYEGSRILASLLLEPHVARAVGSGNATVTIDSYTASGIFMGGEITAQNGGDPAIIASWRDCI